jgi:hypothetical protein
LVAVFVQRNEFKLKGTEFSFVDAKYWFVLSANCQQPGMASGAKACAKVTLFYSARVRLREGEAG